MKIISDHSFSLYSLMILDAFGNQLLAKYCKAARKFLVVRIVFELCTQELRVTLLLCWQNNYRHVLLMKTFYPIRGSKCTIECNL